MEELDEGLRECDECGRVTDAGEFPDWVDGVCEICDPEVMIHPDNLARIGKTRVTIDNGEERDVNEETDYLCPVCSVEDTQVWHVDDV